MVQATRDVLRNVLRIGALVFIGLFLCAGEVAAQKSKTQKSTKKTTTAPKKTTTPTKKADSKPAEKVERNFSEEENKVKNIITFLQFVLNTLGSSTTPSRDKDVLVTESYSKIFRDDQVQVEDDLDEDREVITNKDVVAYLKDVDFFFQDVKFDFVIDDIKSSTLPSGELFYKVSLHRNLVGTTADGRKVSNNMPRYVEINFNPEDQDLKIVSIYTNEFDERAALTEWWKNLSHQWQQIFREKLSIKDSVSLENIKSITAIQDLDLGSNRFIQDLGPLSQLPDLKLLNLAATNITDLTPIRNLTELVELDLQNTKVEDLGPLKYASKLVRLNLNHTLVHDISVLTNLPSLRNLELAGTGVMDFSSLPQMTELLHLNVSSTQISNLSEIKLPPGIVQLSLRGTPVKDIAPLAMLQNLQTIEIDSTGIRDLTPLGQLQKLSVIHANYTFINDLTPLIKVRSLQRIYCDQSNVSREKADAFIAARPDVLIVFNSKDLRVWWEDLDKTWRSILAKTANIRDNPTNEELAVVTSLDSIDAANTSIATVMPLKKLLKLRVLLASNTPLVDLSALSQHRDLLYLDISNTPVSDVSPVTKSSNLKSIRMNRTSVKDFSSLVTLKSLTSIYADGNAIGDVAARDFLAANPTCLVIYKTPRLQEWWKELSTEWKDVFYKQLPGDTAMTSENLHRLVEKSSLSFSDASVRDIAPLSEFVNLVSLHFSGTGISHVFPLENLTQTLTSLQATNSPIHDLTSLAKFTLLEDLDVSNTPADELRPVSGLKKLIRFNCSGTQIKKLDALEDLDALQNLDCSNTKVTNLSPLESLPLRSLKCYNTRVSAKEVEKFKDDNRNCNVVYYR
jgi:Leucine-rich repeat (LRR) protein